MQDPPYDKEKTIINIIIGINHHHHHHRHKIISSS